MFTAELVSFILNWLCDCKAPVSSLEFILKAVLALGTGLVFSEKKIPKEYNELKDKNKNIGSACTTTCDNYQSPSTGQIV